MKKWAVPAGLLLVALAALQVPASAPDGEASLAEARSTSHKPLVASVGLCADQMLLMLGDREQIASLSFQATGPLSHYADRAAGLPLSRGSVEEVIASGADVLLVSDTMDSRSLAALSSFGVRVIQVPLANEWSEVDALTRTVAAALGQKGRGEQVLADMHQRLARLRPQEPREEWPSVVYYRPDGGGAGAGTFVHISLEAAGFRNLQLDWGPPMWSGVPIERVVGEPPDLFAVSYFDNNTNGLTVLRRNPVLWGAARTRPVLEVYGKYWNCGSPLLVEAVEQLADERVRLFEGKHGA